MCLCRQYLGPLGAQLDQVDQQLVLFLRELFDRMASSHLRNPFGDRFLEFRRDIGSAERPHQGCQRIHQMVQNTRPPPASRKKSRPDNSDLSVPMLFLLQSAIEYAAFWISFVGLAKRSPVFGMWLLCECHAAKCTALAKCLAAYLAEKTRVIFPTWLEAKNRCQCVHAIAAVLTDHG